MQQLFDLSLTETAVGLKIGTQRFIHYFAKPALADLVRHQEQVVAQTRTRDFQTLRNENDSVDADLELWEKIIMRVENYQRDGRNLMDDENWKSQIPAIHKQRTVQGLFQIGIYDGFDIEINSFDEIAVTIKALQNGMIIGGLVHRFRTPLPSELRKWQSISAASHTKFERGETVLIGRTRLADQVALYDLMILKIGGYAYGDNAVTSAKDARELVPAFHKSFALAEAFRQMGSLEDGSPLALEPSSGGCGQSPEATAPAGGVAAE